MLKEVVEKALAELKRQHQWTVQNMKRAREMCGNKPATMASYENDERGARARLEELEAEVAKLDVKGSDLTGTEEAYDRWAKQRPRVPLKECSHAGTRGLTFCPKCNVRLGG